MKKNKKKIKIRFEYKVLIFFVALFILYLPYKFFFQEAPEYNEFAGSSMGSSVGSQKNKEYKSPSKSIKDAISAERPITISEEDFKKHIGEIGLTENDILGMEKATESSTSTVWIYMRNDGIRKDDIASKFCDILKVQGMAPQSVMIMDATERKKGKIIEMGEARCS